MKSFNTRTTALSVLASLTLIFLWAPVILLIVLSFSSNKYGIKWDGFTLKWYSEILNNSAVLSALTKSFLIASITVIVAAIAGTFTAYGLYKFKFRGKNILRLAILLPIVMPYVVTGGSLLLFFTRVIHIPLGYASILIAHFTFSVPLAVFVILGRMQRIDWTLEEASIDLGANRLTTLRKITLPLLLPGIVASAALIFPWSFNDITITYFVAGIEHTTLPIHVFSQIRYGNSSVINTIATIFVLVGAVALFLWNFLQEKETT